jgi:hypothetical protein
VNLHTKRHLDTYVSELRKRLKHLIFWNRGSISLSSLVYVGLSYTSSGVEIYNKTGYSVV